MIYKIELTVPANTAKVDFVSDTMKLTKGVIKVISVYFPWGCAGLVGIQIIRRTWPLMPLTRGEWMTGNELLHSYNYNFNLTTQPYELIIRGYNLDDSYEHTPFIIIEILKGDRSIALDKLLSEL